MVDRAAYEAELADLPRERTALLPGLHCLEALEGFVAIDGLRALSDHIRVPAVEVHAAATTYNELRFQPPPPDLRRLCTGLACRLNGADHVLAELRAVGAPVEEVPCLFACGVAPVGGDVRSRALLGRVTSDGLLGRAPSPDDGGPALPPAAGVRRLLVGGGSCGRAVGAAHLLDLFRSRGLEVVETGCDGACWSQPVVRVQLADARTTVLQIAAGGRDAAEPLSGVPLDRQHPGHSGILAENNGHSRWLAGQEGRVTARWGVIDPASIDEYRATGGYEGLRRALVMPAGNVVSVVEQSGLLGRGGAYFPAARKWRTAIGAPEDVYLVVNIEEGEPGVYKDRHLCEGDPHAVIEGTLIAAYALQARRVYLYINGRADLSAERLTLALQQARAAGLVSAGLAIEFRRGAGGYVCGEESVILNSIEGRRAVPRPRPPLPAESGLWGRPTVINNAETLACLPLILRHGAEWFRTTGTEQAPGTKLLCVSGAVPRSGLVEVPFGISLRSVVEEIAGAAPGATVAVVAGGPSGGLIPERLLDMPVRPGVLDEGGAMLGAGGITVLDGTLSPIEAVRQLTAYNAAESCGKCTPCREGTARIEAILATVLHDSDLATLTELNETIRLASLCGLGQAAPSPVTSLLLHFPFESGDSGDSEPRTVSPAS